MAEQKERFTIEIVEILPADLPTADLRSKGLNKLDPRRTCLDCGYLRYVKIRQVDATVEGKPVFERTEDLVRAKDRRAILCGGTNQINARDLDCFRGIWSVASAGGDMRDKIKKGSAQATKKFICRLFFPFCPDDTPETHRELHKDRTARRYNIIAGVIGGIVGGLLTLVGYWYLSSRGGK
jgi:hypothetical protein